MIKTYNIPEFLKYLNIDGCKSDAIHIARYDEHKDLRVKSGSIFIDFYILAIKWDFEGYIDFGPTKYDESTSFACLDNPDSELKWNLTRPWSGYHIAIDTKLFSKHAKDYSFTNYHNHEALFLTRDEKTLLVDIFEKAYAEYRKDNFSKEILVAYATLVISYIHSFYERQFETRGKKYSKVVADFYENLEAYFDEKKKLFSIPSVSFFAKKSNHSPNYFGDVVKYFTGASPIEHIHDYVIKIAKSKLRQPDLTIKQVASDLGFEYPTYFTRFFKKETGITPAVFRNQ